MKHIIMCINAIKDTGKGNNINKCIFQFWRLYVRIHSHGGKFYTHLFLHSIDIRMRIVYIMVQTCVNVYAMCTHWRKIIRIISLMILQSLFHL